MSVQFRTSQKDLITQSNSAISKEIGVCCKYDFTDGAKKEFSTPLDCYLNSGTFFYAQDLNAVNCFDISASSGLYGSTVLGCCCACSIAAEDDNYDSYISQMTPVDAYCDSDTVPEIAKNTFGLKKLTQCECERIGGKWTAGECPTELPDDASVRTYCYQRLSLYPPGSSPNDGTNQPPCASNSTRLGSGGYGITYNTFDFSTFGAGSVVIKYDMYNLPDKMEILYPAPYGGATYNDALFVTSTNGLVSGQGELTFNYTPYLDDQLPPAGYTGTYTKFVVKVTSGPNTNTRWEYSINCPTTLQSLNFASSGISCDIDLRLPRSCCYFDYDINGFPVGISCENTCNPRDCELKSISSNPSVFSTGTICSSNILSSKISASPYNCSNAASLISTNSTLFQNIPYGSCYTIIDNGSNGYSYSCDITAEFFCYDGYWVENTDGSDLCFNNPYYPQLPIKSSRKVEPEIMNESDFLNLNIRIGQFYKGGYYIGTFEPGSPISPSSSKLYGSEQFTYPSVFNSNANGVGDKNKKWALFVEPMEYDISLFSSDEVNSTNYELLSMYDGYYNCYGNANTFSGIKSKTTNTIVGKNRKGFVDFYIPSTYELMFFAYQLVTNNYLADLLAINGIYMTSSSYNNFMYSQYLSENPIYISDETQTTNYGRVLLSKPTSYLKCRFFRKIILI